MTIVIKTSLSSVDSTSIVLFFKHAGYYDRIKVERPTFIERLRGVSYKTKVFRVFKKHYDKQIAVLATSLKIKEQQRESLEILKELRAKFRTVSNEVVKWEEDNV
jgi:hypothetical protein